MDRQTVRLVFVVAVFVLSGVYLFVLSEGGLVERFRLKKEIRSLLDENYSVKIENDRLRNTIIRKVEKKPSNEEMINSGFLKKGDKIIIIRDDLAKTERTSEARSSGAETDYITLYRILWGVVAVSVFILLYFFWRKTSTNES